MEKKNRYFSKIVRRLLLLMIVSTLNHGNQTKGGPLNAQMGVSQWIKMQKKHWKSTQIKTEFCNVKKVIYNLFHQPSDEINSNKFKEILPWKSILIYVIELQEVECFYCFPKSVLLIKISRYLFTHIQTSAKESIFTQNYFIFLTLEMNFYKVRSLGSVYRVRSILVLNTVLGNSRIQDRKWKNRSW